jgi:hypothetical protein
MTRWYFPPLAGACLLAGTTSADAALQITVGDLELLPGQTGFVDVMIRSDTGADLLNIFGLEFQITTSGSTRLEFVWVPSPHVPGERDATDPHLNTPPYLLNLDSLAEWFPPAGRISTTTTTNDTYIGGDGTIGMSGVPVLMADTLLTTLEVTAATAAPPVIGDTFTISLVPDFSTFFWDPDFLPIGFSSTSGTVTIVPEPSTFSIFLALGAVGTIASIIRRRRS